MHPHKVWLSTRHRKDDCPRTAAGASRLPPARACAVVPLSSPSNFDAKTGPGGRCTYNHLCPDRRPQPETTSKTQCTHQQDLSGQVLPFVRTLTIAQQCGWSCVGILCCTTHHPPGMGGLGGSGGLGFGEGGEGGCGVRGGAGGLGGLGVVKAVQNQDTVVYLPVPDMT